MSLLHKLSITVAALGAAVASSQAALTNFTGYGLSGTTASWDVFAGANYLQAFSFSTVDTGNSITGYTGDLTLNATIPGWVSSSMFTKATGPTGSDGSTIPGNRELFYTFFASQVNWGISGAVEENTATVVLQFQNTSGSAGGLSNMTLNGIPAIGSTDPTTLVTTYSWSDLDLETGDAFALAWTNNSQHSAFDAFQLQTGNGAVPEPSALVLAGISMLGLTARRKRRNG